jgi:UDP-glucose 4-epimerase
VKEVINTFNQILSKKIKFKVGPRRQGDSQYIVATQQNLKKPLDGNLNLIILNIF